jgi:hypothetical protein
MTGVQFADPKGSTRTQQQPLFLYSRMVIEQAGLDATLANAEAALARAAFNPADHGADWAAISRKLGIIRPYCRQLRAALAELDATESTDNIDTARSFCRELRAIFLELNPAATIPFRCDQPSCSVLRSPRTTCWVVHLESAIDTTRHAETLSDKPASTPPPSPAPAVQHYGANSANQEFIRPVARARPPLLRQTFDLLILVAAYLQYYFIDVQLQILSLPFIFTFIP